MFNRRINEDIAAVKEIVNSAVSKARVPGRSASSGNASNAYGAMLPTLLPAPLDPIPIDPTDPTVITRGGTSGIDSDGNIFFPFVLGIDTFETIGAYIMMGYPTKNYGN